MPSDTDKGVIATSQGAPSNARAFYSTTYSTQYPPKKLQGEQIQAIAYNDHIAQAELSPSSAPHANIYGWKESPEGAKTRFLSETKQMHNNKNTNSHDNWMPPHRINNGTAFVIAHTSNIQIAGNNKDQYQTTSMSDFKKPQSLSYRNSPTHEKQDTSFVTNNLSTQHQEDKTLHLYDGEIDARERSQREKNEKELANQANGTLPGALAGNSYVRDAPLVLQPEGAYPIRTKNTEYNSSFVSGRSGKSSPSSLGGVLRTRESGFTHDKSGDIVPGSRDYVTESSSQFRTPSFVVHGLTSQGGGSGFVNGHPMGSILQMPQSVVQSTCQHQHSCDCYLDRLQEWRRHHLNV